MTFYKINTLVVNFKKYTVYPKHTMYFFYHVGKEPDRTQFLLLDYMNISVAQILDARIGKSSSKWPNGEIPYTFDFTSIEPFQEGLSEAEQNIAKKVVARFNKDLNGCVSIR